MNRAIVLAAFLVAVAWPTPQVPASSTVGVWVQNNTAEPVALKVQVFDPSSREVLQGTQLLGPYGVAPMGNITASDGDWGLIVQTPGRDPLVRLFESNIEVRAGDAWLVRFMAEENIVRMTRPASEAPLASAP